MPKFTLTHEINCGPERFWQLFFDKEFNEKLYRGQLGFPEFAIVDSRDNDKETWRKAVGKPKMTMPGAVQKVLGDAFGYTDEGALNKATGVFKFKVTPSKLADKLTNEGSVRVEKIGDNKLRRVVELVIEARVFGIGGMIESSTEKQLRQGWDDSAAFMNKYLVEHP
jgi:hypothetical protein